MMFNCGLEFDCLLKVGSYNIFMNIVRYYPFAGLLFALFYMWKKSDFVRFKIQEKYPNIDKIKKEIIQSFVTLIVFSGIATTVYILNKLNVIHTKMYRDPELYGGVSYMILSFILITIWHETWFYWAHRIMHHKKIYSYVHAVHHQSVNPTPIAAYNFHWIEAIFEGIYVVPFLLIFPMYYPVFLIHTFYAMFLNMYFHSGFEFYPKGFTTNRFFKWINTSTHHNLHHSKFNGNYSLYFNFWDRVMGTNFKQYEEAYDKVVEKRDSFQKTEELITIQ